MPNYEYMLRTQMDLETIRNGLKRYGNVQTNAHKNAIEWS
jgi:hypothetical protein